MIKLCVNCAHRDTAYTNLLQRIDVCRVKAALGPNLVTGVEEWQGKTMRCDDARTPGDVCGPAGKLFKQKPGPWWRVDAYGWPIEWITNRPVLSFFRLIFQNIRKVTG